MALTYFGNESIAGSMGSGWQNRIIWCNTAVWTQTCPGTGIQSVGAFEARIWPQNLAGSFWLICYLASDNSLVFKGQVTLGAGLGQNWYGITDPSLFTPANPTLTGGTNYKLALMVSNNSWIPICYNTAFQYNGKYSARTYTDGPEDPAPTVGTNLDSKLCIRCGVEPFASSFPDSLLERRPERLVRW